LILQAVKELHELGYISRDVKPGNFVTGPTTSDEHRNVFMIDFGLCKKYKDAVGFFLSKINFVFNTHYPLLLSRTTTFFLPVAKLDGVAQTDMAHCKRIADRTWQEETTSKAGFTCWLN
jgi:serine/threonine protein kinase